MLDKLFKKKQPEYTPPQPKRIEKNKEKCYSVGEEIQKVKDLSLTPDERSLLEQLGNDKRFISVVDKLIFGVCVSAVNNRDLQMIAERRGGVKALECLKLEVLKTKGKKTYNSITGEQIQ